MFLYVFEANLCIYVCFTCIGDRPLKGFDDLIVDTLLSEMKKSGKHR